MLLDPCGPRESFTDDLVRNMNVSSQVEVILSASGSAPPVLCTKKQTLVLPLDRCFFWGGGAVFCYLVHILEIMLGDIKMSCDGVYKDETALLLGCRYRLMLQVVKWTLNKKQNSSKISREGWSVSTTCKTTLLGLSCALVKKFSKLSIPEDLEAAKQTLTGFATCLKKRRDGHQENKPDILHWPSNSWHFG